MNQRDREILIATRDALDEAINAMAHGEPSPKNGVFDREGWQELFQQLDAQSKRVTAHLTQKAATTVRSLRDMIFRD
jgi:hypothetical protein